jgi:hypothetical protein
MAQADSVPSSSRQSITGESANQSTNLQAVNLPAIEVKPANRRGAIIGSDEMTLIWGEKRGDGPEGPLKRRCHGARRTCARTSKLSSARTQSFSWGGCSGGSF